MSDVMNTTSAYTIINVQDMHSLQSKLICDRSFLDW